MKNFLFHLGRRPSVKGLKVSAALPASGIDALDNSEGAAKTTAELSEVLDESLEDFNIKGDWPDRLRSEVERLQHEVEKYPNGRVEELNYGKDWSCTQEEAQVIYLAANCAASAYDDQVQPWNKKGLSLERVAYIDPSKDGTTKATSFTFGKADNGSNSLLPALLIAIRGTDSVVDSMVNANSESRSAQEYLAIPNFENLTAHAGFLNGARALSKKVLKQLEACLTTLGVKHVVLTGHSAGGATAALLTMHFLARSQPDVLVSCITFGAPPVTQPDLTGWVTARYSNKRNLGLLLAFANERDLVSRVDGDYVRSLVNLYRKARGYPSVQHVKKARPADSQAGRSELEALESVNPSDQTGEEGEEKTTQPWPLPEPEFCNFGKIIVSRNATPDDVFELRPVSVLPEEFSRLIFCDIRVHSRKIYVENAEALLETTSAKNEEAS